MQHIYADYCRPRRQTGRILDGKPAGYMRTLRALCSKQLGLTRQNRTPRNSSESYRRRRVPGERECELERDILETGSNFAIDSSHPCSFVFSNNFADIFKRFHVLFRFRPGWSQHGIETFLIRDCPGVGPAAIGKFAGLGMEVKIWPSAGRGESMTRKKASVYRHL